MNKVFLSLTHDKLASRDRIKGFMLLEVIMSIFIVTVGVVFVIGSFITSVKTYKVSRVYSELQYLVAEAMWEYEASGEIEETSDSGDFKNNKNASWKIKAIELEDIPINETRLEVTIKEDEMKRSFEIMTYLRKKEEVL